MKRGGDENQRLGNIWDVVSTLAHALTDARDQLVGLINHTGTRGKRFAGSDKGFRNAIGFRHSFGKENIYHSNGDFGSGPYEYGGGYTPRYRGGGYIPSGKQLQSVHRQHARGHVAFGQHSEFKPQLPRKTCKPKPPRSGGSGSGKSGKKAVQFGLYLDPKSNCLQIQTKKGGNNPLRIEFGGQSQGPQYACNKDTNCRPSSPDSKRHCIGTQYAALLKEEAIRIRERRLAEEKDANLKPKWRRC